MKGQGIRGLLAATAVGAWAVAAPWTAVARAEQPDPAPVAEAAPAGGTAQPEAARHQAPRIEAPRTETAQPEGAQPDIARTETRPADAAQPETGQPEATQPEATQPETTHAGMGTDEPAAASAAPEAPVPPAASEPPVTAQAPAEPAPPAIAETSTPAAPDQATAAGIAPAAPAPMASEPGAASPAAGEAPRAPEAAPVPVVAENPLAPVAAEIGALLVAPGPDAFAATKKEREALAAFYAEHQDLPVFVDARGLTPRGAAVMARFAAAGEDGLDPTAYQVPTPAASADAATLARTELRLAGAALLYARHAQAGRFDPSRISALVTPARSFPEPAAVLVDVSTAEDANRALAAYNPPHAGYLALKAKLAAATGRPAPAPAAPAAPMAIVPPGPLLRPGAVDARVPVLRARLGTPAARGAELVYDADLAETVRAFQEAAGQTPDGLVGPATVAMLNRAAEAPTPERGADRTADIVANMERWRWLPRDLGAAYVMVNIPEFMVRIYDDGNVVHETRVVVGKPATPTPLLSHDMEYVVVNPAWNIPPSIARKEMMPLLQRDPSALSRMGIEVVRSGSGGYSFRQPPGERNALGRIKFMFPNDHSVYLHDTPSKALFAQQRRAFSHGCMRVQEPLAFGEVVFSLGMPGEAWSQSRIGKMLGGSERYLMLKRRIPVHVVYFNAIVDPAGRLTTREDIYGINAAVKAQLGLDGKRRVADRSAAAVRR